MTIEKLCKLIQQNKTADFIEEIKKIEDINELEMSELSDAFLTYENGDKFLEIFIENNCVTEDFIDTISTYDIPLLIINNHIINTKSIDILIKKKILTIEYCNQILRLYQYNQDLINCLINNQYLTQTSIKQIIRTYIDADNKKELIYLLENSNITNTTFKEIAQELIDKEKDEDEHENNITSKPLFTYIGELIDRKHLMYFDILIQYADIAEVELIEAIQKYIDEIDIDSLKVLIKHKNITKKTIKEAINHLDPDVNFMDITTKISKEHIKQEFSKRKDNITKAIITKSIFKKSRMPFTSESKHIDFIDIVKTYLIQKIIYRSLMEDVIYNPGLFLEDFLEDHKDMESQTLFDAIKNFIDNKKLEPLEFLLTHKNTTNKTIEEAIKYIDPNFSFMDIIAKISKKHIIPSELESNSNDFIEIYKQYLIKTLIHKIQIGDAIDSHHEENTEDVKNTDEDLESEILLEAIEELIDKNDLDELKVLLKHEKITQEILVKAIKEYIDDNQLYKLEILLKHANIEKETIEEAIEYIENDFQYYDIITDKSKKNIINFESKSNCNDNIEIYKKYLINTITNKILIEEEIVRLPEQLKKFIKTHEDLEPEILLVAIEKVINANNSDSLQILLTHKNITTEILSEAILITIASENQYLIKYLIKHKNTTPEIIADAIGTAIDKNDLDALKILINYKNITPEIFLNALIKIIDNNNIELLETILEQNTKITSDIILQVIKKYIDKETNIDLFDIIIEFQNQIITKETLKEAINYIDPEVNLSDINKITIEYLRKKIVYKILMKNINDDNSDQLESDILIEKDLTPEMTFEAIQTAFYNNKKQVLISLTKYKNINQEDIGSFLESILSIPENINNNNITMLIFLSIMSKNLSFLENLLKSAYVTEDIINQAKDRALEYGNIDAFEILIKKANMNEIDLESTIKSCFSKDLKGNLDYLKIVIKNQHITEKNIDIINNEIIYTQLDFNQNKELLSLLIEKKYLKPKTIINALKEGANKEVTAVLINHDDIKNETIIKIINLIFNSEIKLEYLHNILQCKNITPKNISYIIDLCFFTNNKEALKIIIDNKNITPENISYIIDLCSKTNNKEALKIVIENKNIPKEVIGNALIKMIIKKDQESFNIIVQHPNINPEYICEILNNYTKQLEYYKEELNNQKKTKDYRDVDKNLSAFINNFQSAFNQNLLSFINNLQSAFNQNLDNKEIVNIIKNFKVDYKQEVNSNKRKSTDQIPIPKKKTKIEENRRTKTNSYLETTSLAYR